MTRHPTAVLPSREGGFTLVEVLVSLVIVFIVFLGLSDTGLLVLRTNARIALQEEGGRLAGEAMERARSTPFDNLVTSTDNVVRPFRNQVTYRYLVNRTVSDLDTDNKRVTIVATWRYLGTAYTQTLSTIVRRR
jgi:type II secretory pathway pseudopilin PulG